MVENENGEILQKAIYLINLKKNVEASKYLKDLLSKKPLHPRGLALFALCHLNLGDNKKAIEFAEQSNAQAPNYQALVVLTMAHFYQRNYKKLKKIIQLGKSLYPYGYEFFEYEALMAKEKHQYKKATRILDKAIQVAPNNVELYNLKGEVLNLRGKRKQAKATFDIALTINPNHPQTHNNQGWLALEKGHFEEAKHFFATALRKDPTLRAGFNGFTLALKSDLRWFRPFIRYIAYIIKAGPILFTGIMGGLISQAGKLASESWKDPFFFALISKIFLGIILFFWFPFMLSAAVGIELAERPRYKRFLGGEEKQSAQRQVIAFGVVFFIWIILLLFA